MILHEILYIHYKSHHTRTPKSHSCQALGWDLGSSQRWGTSGFQWLSLPYMWALYQCALVRYLLTPVTTRGDNGLPGVWLLLHVPLHWLTPPPPGSFPPGCCGEEPRGKAELWCEWGQDQKTQRLTMASVPHRPLFRLTRAHFQTNPVHVHGPAFLSPQKTLADVHSLCLWTVQVDLRAYRHVHLMLTHTQR